MHRVLARAKRLAIKDVLAGGAGRGQVKVEHMLRATQIEFAHNTDLSTDDPGRRARIIGPDQGEHARGPIVAVRLLRGG